MKKKTTKKIRTVSIELEKAKTPIAVESIKASLDSLEASTGWGIIRNILDENIKFLEECILTGVDPITKTELDSKAIEEARIKRSLNIEVRDTPKNYRAKIDTEGATPKNFDPFYMTREEINRDNVL